MSEKPKLEILCTMSLSEAQIGRIQAVDKNIHLNLFSAKAAQELTEEQWQKFEVLLTASNTLPDPEKAPKLKWIQHAFAGVEPVLNFPITKEKSVLLTNGSGTMISQMGEYVLMALLLLGHKLPETIALQNERKWGGNHSKSLLPNELRDSTVGIVGYGSIGREVARLLYSFGSKVLAAKNDLMHPEDPGYTPQGLGDPMGNYFQRLYPIEALNGMLEACDFVVITVPLTEKTHHLFSASTFKAMKPGTFLVNVSRGPVIDEAALVQAIRDGVVAGAVLDVFEQEPLPVESPLWNLPNVIITPHISGISTHFVDDVVDLFVVNLKRYIAGEELYNLVDPEKEY